MTDQLNSLVTLVPAEQPSVLPWLERTLQIAAAALIALLYGSIALSFVL